MKVNYSEKRNKLNIPWLFVLFDFFTVAAVAALILPSGIGKSPVGAAVWQYALVFGGCVFSARFFGRVYGQTWRYGGIQSYIRLIFADFAAFAAFLCLELILVAFLPSSWKMLSLAGAISLFGLNTLGSLFVRMLCRYAFNCGNKSTAKGKASSPILRGFSGIKADDETPRLHDFDPAELLLRKPVTVSDEHTTAYYRDKTVLITGGGGSIGSELCRQLTKMCPKRIIILDIYENGAYDVQQELKSVCEKSLDLKIEICSVTDKVATESVFRRYRPQIVIHAAAHKHVPLMEDNCIEAIYNNVFGTLNLTLLCEKYEAERFIMVSTDKAVNPTSVMGATKRMCEMLVQSASTHGKVKYSTTRFGNVLGSAGSVIPLFKRQIANGGPVTITDRRVTRSFMTISEAAQLVLQSGAFAKSGELFVLDMGQPLKIADLAENMIRLSGAQGIEIVETGLRPGEKLYEELLVKPDELDTTSNSMIFTERDVPLGEEEINEKLEILKSACQSGDNEAARAALKRVVPTYKSPEEVNSEAT